MHVERQRGRAAVAAELGGHHDVGREVGAQAAVGLAARRCRAGRRRAGRRSSRTESSLRGPSARRGRRTCRGRAMTPARAVRVVALSVPTHRRQSRTGRPSRASQLRLSRKRNQHRVDSLRRFHVRQVARHPRRQRYSAPAMRAAIADITAGGALRSSAPARHSTGTSDVGQRRAAVEADDRMQRAAVGGFGHRAHQQRRARHRVVRCIGRGHALDAGPAPAWPCRGRHRAAPGAAPGTPAARRRRALPKAGEVASSTIASTSCGALRDQVLRHHAAHAVADQRHAAPRNGGGKDRQRSSTSAPCAACRSAPATANGRSPADRPRRRRSRPRPARCRCPTAHRSTIRGCRRRRAAARPGARWPRSPQCW